MRKIAVTCVVAAFLVVAMAACQSSGSTASGGGTAATVGTSATATSGTGSATATATVPAGATATSGTSSAAATVGTEATATSSTSSTAAGSPAGGNAAKGKTLFASSGCTACHTIGGQGGKIGPDLTAVGSRLTQAQIEAQVTNPKQRPTPYTQITSGAVMPKLPLTAAQIADIAAYLATQKG